MIKEVITDQVLSYEHIDGDDYPCLDAYLGCSIRCPYCFRWNVEGWNKDILVRVDYPEKVAEELCKWPKDKTSYIGSMSEPYQEIEHQYQLTRRTLIAINELGLPSFITTKGDSDLLCRDIDVFHQFGGRITILVSLSSLLPSLEQCKAKQRDGVKAIQRLKEAGIAVQGIISPVLPRITDVDEMLSIIPEDVIMVIDKIRTGANTPSYRRFLSFIKKHYTSQYEHYAKLAEGETKQWQELLSPYLDGKRDVRLGAPL